MENCLEIIQFIVDSESHWMNSVEAYGCVQ
jgi:hypothetical protein